MKLSTILGKKYNDIVETLAEEEIRCVTEGLKRKGITNPLTNRVVLDYLCCHKKVYGDILETIEVAENIVRNMDKDIAYFSIMSKAHGGQYSTTNGQIRLNFVNTLASLFKRKRRCNLASVLRHELDHCATTKTKLRKKRKASSGIFLESCFNDVWASLKHDVDLNEKWISEGLCCLDEGITVFKQNKFDEAKGSKPLRHSDFYEIYVSVAKHIATIIGEKKMVKFQYDGDFFAMCEDYFEKIGMNLAVIVYYLGEVGCGNSDDSQARQKALKRGQWLLTCLETAERGFLEKQKEDEKE